MIQLAHRVYCYKPTKIVEKHLNGACGMSRYAYNWAKDRNEAHYKETQETLSEYDLVKEFNLLRKEELPWTYKYSKWACQSGIQNFCTAIQRFFDKVCSYPQKKRRKDQKSCYYGPDAFRIKGRRLYLGNMPASLKLSQLPRFPGKIASVTVSQDKSGEWFASFLVNVDETYEYPHKCETQAQVGLDLGFNTYATLSNGEKISLLKPLRAKERKLKKLQRAFSKTKKGSKGREKARLRVARLHRDIRNIRDNQIHLLTNQLVKKFSVIAIEDLNVKGISRSLRFGKSVSDAGFGEFRRQLEYKAKLAGCKIVVVDRMFANSKTCSACNVRNTEVVLGVKHWSCPSCGAEHDRDVNAAVNLLNQIAVRLTEIQNANGEDGRPNTYRKRRKRHSSVKLESYEVTSVEKQGSTKA